MIDKSWKLQRYDRKDYTELVEFPVEIVGRDGVVRRYSFEEAIRLYQRRISFAGVRDRDTELIAREARHCRSRIEQLRRSWFHRCGWPTPNGQPPAEAALGDLAGEVAAFLGRSLNVSGRLECRVEPVGVRAGGAGTWYVTPPSGRGGMLLEVYRFDGPGQDASREEFFRKLRDFEQSATMRAAVDGDGLAGEHRRGEGALEEQLVASHHVLDCGFLLTGDAEAASAAEGSDVDEDSIDLGPTPWDEALDAMRRGEQALALRRCREVVAAQPWHRQAYVAGAAIAVARDEPILGEELALLGTKYFPADGALWYWLAFVRQQLRRPTAEDAARRAVSLAPELASARLLLAAMLVRTGRAREARSVLSDRPAEAAPQPADGDLAWLRAALAWRVRLELAIACAAVAAAPAVVLSGGWGAGAAIAVVAVGAIGWLRLHADVVRRSTRVRAEDLAVALRRVTRREASPVVS